MKISASSLVAAVDLEDVLLHHEGVGRPEAAHVAQVQLGAGVGLAVVPAQLVLLKCYQIVGCFWLKGASIYDVRKRRGN